ncbi:MAG: hypothetical protein WA642_17340 [Steroidobacteraceae bacterium]
MTIVLDARVILKWLLEDPTKEFFYRDLYALVTGYRQSAINP